jgi:acetyl-CoA C-acetyltransferase
MKSFHNREKGAGILYDDIWLVNGARTAFGKFCGSLANVSPTDLGIYASKGAIEKSGIPADEIDQAIIANIGQSCADAYFLPRHISLYAGLKPEVPALMVQRICASGFETLITGSEQITLGKADTVLCCGTENMSLAPTVSFGNRMGYALGQPVFKDMLWEALMDTAAGTPMGGTAENVAAKHGISRTEADEFAVLSHQRAAAAIESGFLNGEITPVFSTVFEAEGLVPRKVRIPKGAENLTADENVRQTSMEALSRLPAVFSKEGVQTAGNSSGIVDGAAAAVICSGKVLREKKLTGLVKIVGSASCGIDPKLMGLGPVPAIRLLLELSGLTMRDIALLEINEAFAAQYIGCEMELGLHRDKVNVNGGSIALGHPLAATGVRLSLTLARELNARNVRYGIASACIGGGQGTAILLENVNI